MMCVMLLQIDIELMLIVKSMVQARLNKAKENKNVPKVNNKQC